MFVCVSWFSEPFYVNNFVGPKRFSSVRGWCVGSWVAVIIMFIINNSSV